MMSISRLCVRISKCSRESLYLCGERMTQYTFFSVGSGTGPATRAPVRVTVSTIFRAELSMTSWSYALSRMRIFCPAICGLGVLRFVVSRCAYVIRRPEPRGPGRRIRRLLDDLRDPAGADGAAAFADREPEAFLHGDRLDQVDVHVGPVTRHDHLGALGEGHHAGHVGGPEVELRTVVVEERRVAAALVLGQDVDLALELGVRGVGARLDDDLAALHLLALDAAQQQAHVVAGLAVVEDLAEHLHAGDGRGLRLLLDPDDVDGLAGVDGAALDPAGHHGAATGDREDILDRHQERLVDLAYRLRDGIVAGGQELHDLLAPRGVAVERLQRRYPDHRHVVAGELVLGEQLADLELDELEDLLVVHHVRLVQRHHDVGHADLAGEQHVLTGLRHRAVGRGDHEDGTVHLGGTRDHVLDVVRVTRAVHVRVVPLLGLVLDMGDRDGDAALLLLLRVVDRVKGGERVDVGHLVVKHLGDRRGQRGLAVVDMTDGADVDVRLSPLELGLRHLLSPRWLRSTRPGLPGGWSRT